MVREQQLSDVLNEFARTMLTGFPIQAILDRLVVRIVEILPVSSAGVTLITSDSDPRYVAASDDSALRFERLQTELGEGPCLVAYDTGQAVAVADLRREGRFALAADPDVSPGTASAALLRMAGGSTAALRRARTRVESRLTDRPTRQAEAAALALRSALAHATAQSERG